MPHHSRREIVREAEFEEQLLALIPRIEEADDFTAGAEISLSLDPFLGVPVSVDDIWLLPMAPVNGKIVALYYRFDMASVVFLAVLPVD